MFSSMLHYFITVSAFLFLCAPDSFGTAVEVVPSGLSGMAQPQVTVAPNGSIHIVFGSGEDIYHVASDDRGRTFAAPTKVASLPKLALGMRRGPRIVAADKILAISAVSFGDGNLHSWNSTDQGRTWKESSRINGAEGSAREGLHAMTGNGRARSSPPGSICAGKAQNYGARHPRMAARPGAGTFASINRPMGRFASAAIPV